MIDLESATREIIQLVCDESRLLHGTAGWNGLAFATGFDNVENTSLAVNQTCFMFAYMLQDKRVDDFIVDYNGICVIHMPKLRDACQLNKIKVLDLGCGSMPAFARIARFLGTTVFTADVCSQFYRDPQFMYQDKIHPPREPFEWLENETTYHVIGDLNDSDVVDTILERSGGSFDIVTEAHLSSSFVHANESISCKNGKHIAQRLLKDDGLYVNGLYCDIRVKKELM